MKTRRGAGFPISILVEGITDEVVAKRLIEHAGLALGAVYGGRGKPYLLQRLPAYNSAARFAPWVTVVDLDNDATCAPAFVAQTLPRQSDLMRLRVAVRAIESWLMADAEGLAAFLGVRTSDVPSNSDALTDPKTTLVNLARRSRRTAIRKDMVPRDGSGARVGPNYSGRIIEFVVGLNAPWRVDVAAEHSDSLRRCIAALVTLRSLLASE